MQAEDREPDPVEVGKRDGRGRAAVARRVGPGVPAVGVRQHVKPWFGQVAGGRDGDGVAAEVQARAQRGELAGDGAEWGQGAGRLQRRDDVTEPVGHSGDRPWLWRGRVQPGVRRPGRRRCQQPRRDGVQQVLAGAGRGRAEGHRALWRPG